MGIFSYPAHHVYPVFFKLKTLLSFTGGMLAEDPAAIK
jgi:hypothetical protein